VILVYKTKWTPLRQNNKKIVGIEKSIRHLGFDYFFIRMIKWPIHPPVVKTILVSWNMKFNYYKEQLLKLAMVKHKFKIGSSSRTKQMKFKAKDTILEIQPTLLDQIHFPMCTYITMWASKKEGHAWCLMIFASLIGTQSTYLWSRRSFVTFKFPMRKTFYMRSWLLWTLLLLPKFSSCRWKES
jgi:hypothetical protein